VFEVVDAGLAVKAAAFLVVVAELGTGVCAGGTFHVVFGLLGLVVV
jgi:ribosomal protein S5